MPVQLEGRSGPVEVRTVSNLSYFRGEKGLAKIVQGLLPFGARMGDCMESCGTLGAILFSEMDESQVQVLDVALLS